MNHHTFHARNSLLDLRRLMSSMNILESFFCIPTTFIMKYLLWNISCSATVIMKKRTMVNISYWCIKTEYTGLYENTIYSFTCVMESGGLGLAHRVMCLDCVSISHIEISLLPLTADTTHDPSFGCMLTRRTPAPIRW